MLSFNDLQFKPHPAPFLAERGATQALVKFPNGHSASVVWGIGFYGSYQSYEVWRSVDKAPIMGLDEHEVQSLLTELSEMDPSVEKIGYQALLD